MLGLPQFKALRHDLAFPLYAEVDEIYNPVCIASPIHYQFDPVQTTKTCIMRANNMLGLGQAGEGRVFQPSTSKVYGDPTVHPQTEDYRGNVSPLEPRACYDEGKRAAETLFFDYHRQHKTRIKVLRIFNTYGPANAPERWSGGFQLHVQALRGQPSTLYGDSSQIRAFCFVSDFLDGFVRPTATDDG